MKSLACETILGLGGADVNPTSIMPVSVYEGRSQECGVIKWEGEGVSFELLCHLVSQSKLVLAASNDYATRIWTFHDQQPKVSLKFRFVFSLYTCTYTHICTLKVGGWDFRTLPQLSRSGSNFC